MNTRAYTLFTLISLIVIPLLLTVCQSPSTLTQQPVARVETLSIQDTTVLLNSLPADLIVPPVLPTAIQDQILQEAWIRLYNRQDPIRLWDGSTLTGRDLAQFILENAIPVVWDTNRVCGDASCSIRYCEEDTCSLDDGFPGADPIYINLVIQSLGETQMNRLMGSMSHEIFHRTAPYGNVRDTLYEEFTALYIGAQFNSEDHLNFKDYDGLNPACLQRWFNDSGLMEDYKQYKPYPENLIPLLSEHSQNISCTLPGESAFGIDPYGLDIHK